MAAVVSLWIIIPFWLKFRAPEKIEENNHLSLDVDGLIAQDQVARKGWTALIVKRTNNYSTPAGVEGQDILRNFHVLKEFEIHTQGKGIYI